MAQPARQLDTRPSTSDDYVTADQAAELTRLTVWSWQRRARCEADKSCGGHTLAFKGPPPGGSGKAVWWIHRSLDARLARCPARRTRDERTTEALSAKYPAHAVDRAVRRNRWLRRWRDLVSGADRRVTEAKLAAKVVAEAKVHDAELKVSARSLRRWWRASNDKGVDGIRSGEALIDKHHGPGFGGGSGGGSTRSPEAIDLFYSVFHSQNQISVRVAHDVTLSESQRKGWQWPESYAATTAWLARHDDLSLTCLLREGKDRWCRKYLPHLQFDYGKLAPGAVYLSDHAQCDFWVTYKGKQIRPWLTAVIDSASRRLVGNHIGPSPQQDAILCAMRMAFRDCAIPEKLHIDQGKDFTSKLITGLSKRERDSLRRELGPQWQAALKREAELVSLDDPRWLGLTGELEIDVKYAIPYSPWSKGIVERWFGTFHDQCGKTFATYCGNVLKRPECLQEIRTGYSRDQRRRLKKLYGNEWPKHVILKLIDESAVPTMEEARQRIGEYRDVYNRTAHRGSGMKGRSPLAVWDTATSLRLAVEDDLLCLMNVRGLYRVGANGVSLKIGEARLSYGAKSAALKRWVGRQVLIAVDNQDVSQAWALTPDRKKRELIARLEPNEFIDPYTTADAAREAIAEKKREQSIMHKAARSAARRTRTATQAINRHTREQRLKLLATGTDGKAPDARIAPVPTGFDAASMAGRTPIERPPSEYDKIDLDNLDLSDLFVDEPPATDDDGDDTSLDDLFLDDPAEEDTSDA